MVRIPLAPALLAAAFAAVAGGVLAQPQAPQPAARQPAAQTRPAQRYRDPFPYFIAPSGQPFRAGPNMLPPVEQWFAQADADHDGVITRDEFIADANRFFNFIDVDHDGVINGPENTRYETRVAPEISVGGPSAFGGDLPPSGGDPDHPTHTVLQVQGAARFSFINEPQPIRGADTNLDWLVSSAEWIAASERRFDLLDTDHDGRLTLDTLPRWPDPRRTH